MNKMAATSETTLESECKSALELLNSLQQEGNKFFTGRQTASNSFHSKDNIQAELGELSKLTNALHEKLKASGLHALPLDSETLHLDCQGTVKKSQEDAEESRGTTQRIQTNCVTLNKVMGLTPKK